MNDIKNKGKRIRKVLYKGNSYWNWKDEDDINVVIPPPIDHDNKISYNTNIDLIFNREVVGHYVYTPGETIPELKDLIPTGYKLLYPSSKIQKYNDNRFILVYDYYEVIVHYRNETDINKDINVWRGKFQYGTVITKDMINWPTGRSSKQEWTDFPVGELTHARVIDRYVYLNTATSAENWSNAPTNMQNNSVINLINLTYPNYNTSIVLPPMFTTAEDINKIVNGRIPYGFGLKSQSNPITIDFKKGLAMNYDIDHFVAPLANSHGNLTRDPLKKSGNYWNYGFILFYDKDNPFFDGLHGEDPHKETVLFNKMIQPLYDAMPKDYTPKSHGGTSPMNNMWENLINTYKVVEVEGNIFIGTLMWFGTVGELNIGNLLSHLENAPGPYQDYFRSHLFYIDDLYNNKNDYTARDITINGVKGHLPYIALPLKSINHLGLYMWNNNKMYRHYLFATENAIVNDLENLIPNIADDGTNLKNGTRPLSYKAILDASGNKTALDDYKASFGISYTLNDAVAYKNLSNHSHKGSEVKASLMLNNQSYLLENKLKEASVFIETKSVSGTTDDKFKKIKYRIHFFNENGREMKEYITDQYIKQGEPPSLYPPRGYIMDPNKPWTRNPDDPYELYVYLVKKMCRVTATLVVTNPDSIKNKLWVDAVSKSPIDIFSTTIRAGETVDPHDYINILKDKYGKHYTEIELLSVDNWDGSDNEVEIMDNINFIFRYKIIKADSYVNTIKLSAARTEFGVINPYMDFCLAAVLVNKSLLVPQVQFENNLTDRTNRLVFYRNTNGLDNAFNTGALISQIVYNNRFYQNFPTNLIIPKINIFKVKDGIKTLVDVLTDVNLKDLLGINAMGAEKLGNGTTNFPNKLIASNIAKYLVDDMNNVAWSDCFGVAYANSPDFIAKNIDLEAQIEWPEEIHKFIYETNYVVDLKFIPTALLPIFDLNTIYTDDQIKEGLGVSAYREVFFTPPRSQDGPPIPDIERPDTLNKYYPTVIRPDSDDVIRDYIRNPNAFNYNRMSDLGCESIKCTSFYSYVGTFGFKYRWYQIAQILSNPVPIISLSNDIKNGMMYTYTNNYDMHKKHAFTFTNLFRHKILNDHLCNFIHNRTNNYTGNECVNKWMVKVPFKVNEIMFVSTAYKLTDGNNQKIYLFPTAYDNDNLLYGTTDINDWFKIMTNEVYHSSTNSIGYVGKDVAMYPTFRISGFTMRDFLKSKLSECMSEIYLSEINVNYYGQSRSEIYIQDNKNILRKCNDTSDFMKYGYIFRINNGTDASNFQDESILTAYDIDVIEANSCYKPYLEGRPLFVDDFLAELNISNGSNNLLDLHYVTARQVYAAQDNTPDISKLVNIYEIARNIPDFKPLIDNGLLCDAYNELQNVAFSENSVLRVINTDPDNKFISKMREVKWHMVKDGTYLLIDFDRKYALSLMGKLGRALIMPDLFDKIGYTFSNSYTTINVIDPTLSLEPFWKYINCTDSSSLYQEEHRASFDMRRIRWWSYEEADIDKSPILDSSPIPGTRMHEISSMVYYAMLVDDIFNGGDKDDGHSIRTELYSPRNIEYMHPRYPNNDEVNNYTAIHLFQNLINRGGHKLYSPPANRYDMRFNPRYVDFTFLGYNLYDLAFKLTNMYDYHSSERCWTSGGNDTVSSRWYVGKTPNSKDFKTTTMSPGTATLNNLYEQAMLGNNAYMIAPNISREYGNFSKDGQRYNGSQYNPVLRGDETIKGLSPLDTTNFNISKHERTNLSDDPWKAMYNPYSLMYRKDGSSTGLTPEDIFRQALDPYKGHRILNENTNVFGGYYMVTNDYYTHSDPLAIHSHWMVRAGKYVNRAGLQGMSNYKKPLSDIKSTGGGTVAFTTGDQLYWGGLEHASNFNQDNTTIHGNGHRGAISFHPLHIRGICHPFQRSALLYVAFRQSGFGSLPRIDHHGCYNLYLGYANFNYEELCKYKDDKQELKNYVKRCLLREESGFTDYLNDLRYKYIIDHRNNTAYEFTFNMANLFDDLFDVTYEEIGLDTNDPKYKFLIKAIVNINFTKQVTMTTDIRKYGLFYQGSEHYIVAWMIKMHQGLFNSKESGLPENHMNEVLDYLATNSLEKIEGHNGEFNVPTYYVHKYSIFTPRNQGWSSYNGQWIPKWPVMIPDMLNMLYGQEQFVIFQNGNQGANNLENIYRFTDKLLLCSTSIMPHYIGYKKDSIKFNPSQKFYGAIDAFYFRDARPFSAQVGRGNDIEAYGINYNTSNTTPYTSVFNSGLWWSRHWLGALIDTYCGRIPNKLFYKIGYNYKRPHNYIKIHLRPEKNGVNYVNNKFNTFTNAKDLIRVANQNTYSHVLYNMFDDALGYSLRLNPTYANHSLTASRCAPVAMVMNFLAPYKKIATVPFYKQSDSWVYGFDKTIAHELAHSVFTNGRALYTSTNPIVE